MCPLIPPTNQKLPTWLEIEQRGKMFMACIYKTKALRANLKTGKHIYIYTK